ncbi:glycosyltransferase [Streptomyces sp. NBS 14/10]|uniref:glycosyltransferase family 2 protein n=1 Tax=Streptomyces sp. NBS 14/10 TaxID=1945643 RepID=UPI000B7F90F1|nr:glycosyltransferase [Streptomyces sp. NBS 14/10]KAK1184391.1 glycosyltransferase [Streptomyces sp. NBS 14/10]
MPDRQHATAEQVTVALCSIGRPELVTALSAVRAGDTDAVREVVIVDNAGGALDVPLLRSLLDPVPLRVLQGTGPAAAGRNLVLAQSRTDVVLFTDDDCVPTSSWVRELACFMVANPSVAAAFGAVEPDALPGARIRSVEIADVGVVAWGEASSSGDELWCPAISAPEWKPGIASGPPTVPWALVGSSNNLALRRSRMLSGRPPFLPALGPGTAAGSGEDTELGYALMAHGREIAYVPESLVFHHSWLGASAAERAKRVYFRGNVEALGCHVLNADQRAGQLLQAYLQHFCNVNGFADLGEVLEWGYGGHAVNATRTPLRK